jgi:hypothetical protein
MTTETQARSQSVGSAVAVIAPAAVLVLGMVAAVNILIPKLQASSLHPSVSGTAWIVDSYTLVFAWVLIPAGAIGSGASAGCSSASACSRPGRGWRRSLRASRC